MASYLFVQERNLSLGAMTRLTSALFMGIACTTITTGWIADRLIGGGMSPTQVRRSIAVGGLLLASSLAAFAFDCIVSPDPSFPVGRLPGLWSFRAQSLRPSAKPLPDPLWPDAGAVFRTAVANLAGIVAPSVAGIIPTPEAPCAWPFPW